MPNKIPIRWHVTTDYKKFSILIKENEDIAAQKRTARIAGLLYLLLVVTGFFSLRYVPSKLIDWDNATKTFNNIVSSETLLRPSKPTIPTDFLSM